MREVALLACGGTVDKVYFDAQSSYSVGEPALAAILARARVRGVVGAPVSLLRKDSLEMTAADRAMVAAAVGECAAVRVLITHGTDTMAETARAIVACAGAAGKTVVLTGAFLPAVFRDSDAEFNVGFALAAAQCLSAGVYVAMNGRVLAAESVRKNRAEGRFEEGFAGFAGE